MDWAAEKILVTGGGRGIGREIAREIAKRGGSLVLVGRDAQSLDECARELNANVHTIAADLSDRTAVDALIERCRVEHADLSGLVNNAAIQNELDLLHGPPWKTLEDARQEIALDLDAAVALTIGLLPILRERRSVVANVTTGLVFAPKEASPVYCAAKAGLHAFTQALRYQCERAGGNVGVVEAIMPVVDTDMTHGRGRGKMSPQKAARELVDAIERRRTEAWIGKAKLLRVLRRVAPGVPERILRGDGVGSAS